MSRAATRPSAFHAVHQQNWLRWLGELFWVGCGQGAAVLGALAGVRLMTGLMSPASYGELALGLTITGIIQRALTSPLSAASQRFYACSLEAGQLGACLRDAKRIFEQLSRFLLAIGSAAALAFVALGDWRGAATALLVLLYAWLSGGGELLQAIQNAARHRKIVAIHQGSGHLLRYGGAVASMLLLGPSCLNALLGLAVASALLLGSQAFCFHLSIRPMTRDGGVAQPSESEWRSRLLAYAWPFVVWGTFTAAQAAAGHWALKLLRTDREVGLYAALLQAGYLPIVLLTQLVMQFLGPILFRQVGDGSDAARLHRGISANHALCLAGLLVAACLVLAAHVLHRSWFALLVAPEFHSAAHLLPWVVAAGGLFALGQFASQTMMLGVQTRRLLAPKILSCVAGIALSFWGASWGLYGVVLAQIAYGLLHLASVFVVTRRTTLLSRPKSNSLPFFAGSPWKSQRSS